MHNVSLNLKLIKRFNFDSLFANFKAFCGQTSAVYVNKIYMSLFSNDSCSNIVLGGCNELRQAYLQVAKLKHKLIYFDLK